MKEADARVDYQSHQMLLYVEKSDGAFGALQTGSYMSKNYIDDFWEKRRHLEKEGFEKLTNSVISPIGYYLMLLDMTASDVAHRTGIGLRKVKKHLQHKHFPKINLLNLQRYAEVFGVPVAAFFSIVNPLTAPPNVSYKKTVNPFIVITEISKEQK